MFNTAHADIFCPSLRVPYDKEYKRVGYIVSKVKSNKFEKKPALKISKNVFGKECLNLIVEKWVLLNMLDIWDDSGKNSSEIKEMTELLHRHRLSVKRIFERVDNKKEPDVIKITKDRGGHHIKTIWIDAIEINKILNNKYYTDITINNASMDFPTLLEEFRNIIIAELEKHKKPPKFDMVVGISESNLSVKINQYKAAKKYKQPGKKTILSALDILKLHDNQEIHELGFLLYETFNKKFNAMNKVVQKKHESILTAIINKDKNGCMKIVNIIERYMKENPGKADYYAGKFIESIKGIYNALEKPDPFLSRNKIDSAL